MFTLLAKESILKSNLSKFIFSIYKDITKIDESFNSFFDLIVCNPPYKALKTGKISSNSKDRIIRHETTLTLKQLCREASRLLKFKGRLVISQRTERLVETLIAMKQENLEPKRLKFCAKNKNSPPWLFLVEAKKGAKPFLEVLPTVFVDK